MAWNILHSKSIDAALDLPAFNLILYIPIKHSSQSSPTRPLTKIGEDTTTAKKLEVNQAYREGYGREKLFGARKIIRAM